MAGARAGVESGRVDFWEEDASGSVLDVVEAAAGDEFVAAPPSVICLASSRLRVFAISGSGFDVEMSLFSEYPKSLTTSEVLCLKNALTKAYDEVAKGYGFSTRSINVLVLVSTF